MTKLLLCHPAICKPRSANFDHPLSHHTTENPSEQSENAWMCCGSSNSYETAKEKAYAYTKITGSQKKQEPTTGQDPMNLMFLLILPRGTPNGRISPNGSKMAGNANLCPELPSEKQPHGIRDSHCSSSVRAIHFHAEPQNRMGFAMARPPGQQKACMPQTGLAACREGFSPMLLIALCDSVSPSCSVLRKCLN